jgi:hypothetical protein
MRRIGFSTGALAKGDFQRALTAMRPSLDVASYGYVSVHAPTRFPEADEPAVVSLLKKLTTIGWPIVVHPDVIFNDSLWLGFGDDLILENSDRRKRSGRTAEDMDALFSRFPRARFCFDR